MENSLKGVLSVLEQGEIILRGEFLWGSNYTFLTQVILEGMALPVVYKPIRGERPLWDFPAASLARREVAAFMVSEAIGWKFVPPTVYRKDAPLGPGSLQLYVEHDSEYHYFSFDEGDRQRLMPVALFDLLINNADRKGSHILRDPDGRLWLIDHGLCFHTEDKLRTVIWDFVGEPISSDLCEALVRFRQKLEEEDSSSPSLALDLARYLSRAEMKALGRRASDLAVMRTFPAPDPHRRAFPWPQI